jgi:hypothetical protein
MRKISMPMKVAFFQRSLFNTIHSSFLVRGIEAKHEP